MIPIISIIVSAVAFIFCIFLFVKMNRINEELIKNKENNNLVKPPVNIIDYDKIIEKLLSNKKFNDLTSDEKTIVKTNFTGDIHSPSLEELGFEISSDGTTIQFNKPVQFKKPVDFFDKSYFKNETSFKHNVWMDTTKHLHILPRYSIISWYSSNPIPSGWAICNGESPTPDLRGRFMYMDKHGTLGTCGGVANFKIPREELPKHNHHLNYEVKKGEKAGDVPADYNKNEWGSWNWYDMHYHPQEETNASLVGWHRKLRVGASGHGWGGDQFNHENMPPYCTLLFIMKT
tara:strand:- start:47 stop:913 length:867 start_codon:yes stop_codon:yes gene_type:complete